MGSMVVSCKNSTSNSFTVMTNTGKLTIQRICPATSLSLQGIKGTAISALEAEIANWKAQEDPVPEGTDLHSLGILHRHVLEVWETSPAYDACCALFKDKILNQKKRKITSCMCLGLGIISALNTRRTKDEHTPMAQLVVLETWLKLLRKVSTCSSLPSLNFEPGTQHDIEHVYFQEPHFNPP